MKNLEVSKKMADINYDYFIAHFEELYSLYKDKFVVIKNEKVLNIYDGFDKAFVETVKTEDIGTFLIQHCTKENSSFGNFHSNNVVFA